MATPSLSLARRAAVRLQGVASACRLQPAATARTTRASALPDALRASRPHVVLSLADLRHLKHLRAPLGALRALPRAQPLAALRALRSASCARALWGGRGVGAQPPGGRTVLAAGGRGKGRRGGESKRGYYYGGGFDAPTVIVSVRVAVADCVTRASEAGAYACPCKNAAFS